MNQKILMTQIPQQKSEHLIATPPNIAAWLLHNSDQPIVRLQTEHGEPFLTARYGLIESCGDEAFLLDQLLPTYTAMQTGALRPPEEIARADFSDILEVQPMPDWNCLKEMGVTDSLYFSVYAAQQEAEAADLDR